MEMDEIMDDPRTYMERWYGVEVIDPNYPPGDIRRYGGKHEPDMIGSAYDMSMTEIYKRFTRDLIEEIYERLARDAKKESNNKAQT